MNFIVGTALLALVTALSCALVGAFVVLRKNSMLVDAIGHAILPGIVVGYFFTHDLDSPLLIICAALTGLLVVVGSEALGRTGLLSGDAPQGLIFPALFAGGILLITKNFANIHLDTHAVLVGDLNLAAFHQLIVGGVSIGPAYLYVMAAVLLLNVAVVFLLYPKLKITTFDPAFARTLGIRTNTINTFFMFMVSFTVTAAFNAAGAILVIALMIIPGATAFLISHQLRTMLILTMIIAASGAIVGFGIAYVLDAATSAGITVFYGAVFTLVLIGTRIMARLRHSRHSALHRSRISSKPSLTV